MLFVDFTYHIKGEILETLIAPRLAPNQSKCSVKMRQFVASKVVNQYQSLKHLFNRRQIAEHFKN
jgi:hypothetical protein